MRKIAGIAARRPTSTPIRRAGSGQRRSSWYCSRGISASRIVTRFGICERQNGSVPGTLRLPVARLRRWQVGRPFPALPKPWMQWLQRCNESQAQLGGLEGRGRSCPRFARIWRHLPEFAWVCRGPNHFRVSVPVVSSGAKSVNFVRVFGKGTASQTFAQIHSEWALMYKPASWPQLASWRRKSLDLRYFVPFQSLPTGSPSWQGLNLNRANVSGRSTAVGDLKAIPFLVP